VYEFTHGGWWFNWRTLDQPSRRWAFVSMAAAGVVGGLVGLILSIHTTLRGNPLGTRLGQWFETHHAAIALAGLALLALSLFAWWRMSVRQDEMFNRVQNLSLGLSGAATATVLSVWGYLNANGLVIPIEPLVPPILFCGLLCVCWLVAVRRWA
jgi:hypothetical protein